MKPDSLNNLSETPRSCEDSATENNSLSSDSDLEDRRSEANDQNRNIQGSKIIKKCRSKINELETRLASEKEKSHYQDELIKSLRMSIDLVTQNKDLNIKQLQKQIVELENALDISRSLIAKKQEQSANFERKSDNNESNMREKDEQIKRLECIVQEKNDEIEKLNIKTKTLSDKEDYITQLESKIKVHDAKINEWNQKLSQITPYTESAKSPTDFVFLNCTKIPSVKMITLPDFEPFLAVFEDTSYAGSDWMVIQRRVDGKLSFEKPLSLYENGFGDLGSELWLGIEKIHRLTTNRRHELCIELVDFDDATAFARYDHFVVGSKNEKYALKSLGNYSGNAGDALRSHANESFIHHTYWRWWNLHDCNLMGEYVESKVELNSLFGIYWGRWNLGKLISLKSCKMLIRPKL
ncbi:angiopoietin-related protein 7 [Drosophila biarmipes]|uniref:angiopoietin-related protein 7 n=1 Tax=Drosophila biarmipes TaxID=125945 RepID=UPI0007E635A5|nr:angiopoietin-related protein 7 [Drosophila biarmipes]